MYRRFFFVFICFCLIVFVCDCFLSDFAFKFIRYSSKYIDI